MSRFVDYSGPSCTSKAPGWRGFAPVARVDARECARPWIRSLSPSFVASTERNPQ